MLTLSSLCLAAAPSQSLPLFLKQTKAGVSILPADTFTVDHDAAVARTFPGLSAHLGLASDLTQFHPGEQIPINMDITSNTNGYSAIKGPISRLAFFSRDVVYAESNDGLVDAAGDFYKYRVTQGFAYNGPGPQYTPLGIKPLSIGGNLNDWLRFTKPGVYQVFVVTYRFLKARDDKQANMPAWLDDSAISATSDILTINIVPDDPAWTSATIARAKSDLEDPQAYNRALRTLCYLGSPEAIRPVIDNFRRYKLWDEYNSGDFYESSLGVYGSTDRNSTYEYLLSCIHNKDFAVRNSFVTMTATLKSLIDNAASPHPDAIITNDQIEKEESNLEQLAAASVATKLPVPRAITLYTLLTMGEYAKVRHIPGAPASCRQYAADLTDHFGDLPDAEQDSLLDPSMGAWSDLAQQNIAPTLAALIKSPTATKEVRSEACARLGEIKPSAGRAAILADIVSDAPLLDIGPLKSLQEATLPGLDVKLAAKLTSTEDLDTCDLYSALIERYGTAAIAPTVKKYIDTQWGEYSCRTQANLLAYFLRVAPEYGTASFKRCLYSRKTTGCYDSLFTDVGLQYPCPQLRTIAIQALTDPNSDVEVNAANFLKDYGDNDQVLRARLGELNRREVNRIKIAALAGKSSGSSDYLCEAIIDAITRNTSRLYDHAKLVALQPACITTGEQSALNQVMMENSDLSHITYDPETGWEFGQYRSMTISQVENLAAKCRPGTMLKIRPQIFSTPRYEVESNQLLHFLLKRKMTARLAS